VHRAARILVVEDSTLLRAVARDTLTSHGYEVVEAADGEQGLALAREYVPDVVLCDVEMPKLDGFGVLEGMRSTPGLAEVPVVFLTSHDGSEQLADALNRGAHDYLRKPLEPIELVARVQAAARMKHLHDQLRERNRELQSMTETYRVLVEQVPAVIYRLRVMENRLPELVFASPQAKEILGISLEEIVDQPQSFLGRIAADDVAAVTNRWSGAEGPGAQDPIDFGFTRPDGREIWLRDLAAWVHTDDGDFIQGLTFDITEIKTAENDRKKMELELRLAQKLESVGQLAAGLAHEINTPIQFVADTIRFVGDAFTDVLELVDVYRAVIADVAQRPGAAAERAAEVAEAEDIADLEYLQERIPSAIGRGSDGVQRVTRIVQAMREFAHPPTVEQSPTDLNEALRSTLVVAANEYKYVADVETDLDELPMVICNGGDINQVFLNLIVNAAHAIEDVVGDGGGRGTIRISTRRDGDDVVASIADTGIGMTPEVAARIFDPFFTTKDVGRGTGQGLALAHAIVVDRHGGHIGVETARGEGTRFDVRLPLAGVARIAA
jgi:two-component system, NtrC family, sensor kinase